MSSKRRSGRILLRVPLLVGGVNSSASTEWEQVETLMVSLHGGLLRTHQDFAAGTMLEIWMRNSDLTAHARVVWKSPRATAQGVELGFEIVDHPGFWDVRFSKDAGPVSAKPPKP